VAYDPSARRDSGTTRSKLRGSIAIPEAVFSGKSGGLDMTRVMMRYTCEDTGGEWRSKTNGGSVVVGDLISGIAVSVTLVCHEPLCV
jgi:hypothetical protein